MELRHLRYFSALVREGAFGRAAAALNLAQPALSRQIRDLEAELGVTLLLRTPKGVVTTEEGDVFSGGSAMVLDAVRKAVDVARLAGAGRAGRVEIGVGRIALGHPMVSEALSRLVEQERGLEITVSDVDALQVPVRLHEDTIDLGLGFPAKEGGPLTSELWMVAPFRAAAVAVDHPLSRHEILEPEDLADFPVAFLADARAPDLAALARQAFAQAGIRSPQEFIYNSPNSALMMVSAGRCWVPASLEARLQPGIAKVPIRGFELRVRIDLVWRAGPQRPAVERVLNTLRSLRDAKPLPARTTVPARHPLPVGLELRHLRYFAAVADEGTFGGASTVLGVSQPSLSRQVASLERLIGAALLERTGRGVRVTDAGRSLRKSAARVFDAMDELVRATHGARRAVTCRCVIGAVQTSLSMRVVASVTRLVRERWPHVELFFEDYPTPRQPDMLRSGQIDIGICHAFPRLIEDPDLQHDRLIEDAIDSALLPEGHPLARRTTIAAADLAHVPFLFMPRAYHPAFHDSVYSALDRLGLTPRVEAAYESLQNVWLLVEDGAGWALGFASQRQHPPAGVVAVRIEGLELPWGLDLLWRRAEPNPVVTKVLEVFRKVPTASRQRPSRRESGARGGTRRRRLEWGRPGIEAV